MEKVCQNQFYTVQQDAGIREYDRRDPSRWPRGTLYPQTLALNSPISGGRSVDVGLFRTQATE
jgi:hypothetical protein